MTLRRRLALILLLAALPPLVLGVVMRGQLIQRRSAEVVQALILATMKSGGRQRCERDPAAFGGPWAIDRSPFASIERFAFSSDLRSADPRAPAFPAELARRLAEEPQEIATLRRDDGGPPVLVAVRMSWKEGPCAVVLARSSDLLARQSPFFALLPIVLCAWLLLSVLAAAGSIVARIRLLRASIQRSVESRYEIPVPAGGADEIAELGRAFNEAGKAARAHLLSLEGRDRALRALVSETAHDVALPITALQAQLVDLKQRREGDGIPAGDLAAALEEIHYLSSLVHNLGAGVKLSGGEPEIGRHPVSLSSVVERVVGRQGPLARHLEIAVEIAVPEEPLWVEGDVTLIEQAITNVVHNAVRYNEPGGHVAAVLEARDAGKGFSLRVLDDGPGVRDDELDRLSERCFRGEAATRRRPEGMGLGLHITSRVAACHGFALRFARSDHGGLEVELRGVAFSRPSA